MGESKAGSEGNVRVVLRVRPLAKYELKKGCKKVVVKVPNDNSGGPEAVQVNEGEKRFFELDAVLDELNSQGDVYERSGACKAITEDLFKGFNCTILAYGQTGAGKTFTMGTAAGQSPEITESDGVIPRACMDLFTSIKTKCDGNAEVELSYLEVYNEEIRDLMSADGNDKQLRIRESLNGEVYVSGLTAVGVGSPADIGKLMEEASGRRVVASTKMNATSSRSHAICVLKVKGVIDDTKFQSKLTLVDLAGSERLGKTEATGKRAKEGININKGLFVLGQVVGALAELRPKFKRKPPFRDSKLTRLLQDSLGGNSRTIMVACCSPADFNTEETINTLRYATQARNIKNSATANVIKNISQEEAMKLHRENTLLKQQIAELQETIGKLMEDANLTPEEVARSSRMVELEKQKSRSNLATKIRPGGLRRLSGRFLGRLSKTLVPHLAPAPESEVPPDGDDTIDESSTNMESEDVFEIENDTFSIGDTRKSHMELQAENNALRFKLRNAQRDVKASRRDSAIELPALKVKVMMMEEELEENAKIMEEAEALKVELDQARDDRKSALLAAQQLSDFVEHEGLGGDPSKNEEEFRGQHQKFLVTIVPLVFLLLGRDLKLLSFLILEDITFIPRLCLFVVSIANYFSFRNRGMLLLKEKV